MSEFRAGFVGIIGHPNAGKSSFLNLIVEEKVAIVTSKPQTTRRRVLGVVNQETGVQKGQIVFVDSPGLTNSDTKINQFLLAELQDVIQSADVLVCILNLDEKARSNLEQILQMAVQSKKPWVAVVTKTDMEQFAHRRPAMETMIQDHGGKLTYWVSNQRPDSFDKSKFFQDLLALLPPSPGPLYDVEIFTPHTVRELSEEIIREKCFEVLHQELPYQLAIRMREFKEEPKITKIYADIMVEKDTHKAMVIGKAGENIKKIGMAARIDIEKLVDGKVYLELNVVYKKNWTENSRIMKELGYVVEKS